MLFIRIGFVALMLAFTSLSFATNATVAAATTEPTVTSAININTASAELIASSLNGVGLKKAQAIVDYRKTFGEFKSASELEDVKGIGAKTIAKNQDVIVFE